MNLEERSGQLILGTQPSKVGMILGILLMAMGLGLSLRTGGDTTLSCERQTNRCALTRPRWLSQETETLGIPLDQIQEARLQRSSSSSSSSDTYRVVIATSRQDIPLVRYYSSGRGGKLQYVEQINRFLRDPNQTSLTLVYSDHWLAWVMLAGMGSSGLVLLLIASSASQFRFDRLMGSLEIERRRLWGRQQQSLALTEIEAAEIVRKKGSKGHVSYLLRLLTPHQPIVVYQDRRPAKVEQLARRIQSYLGLSELIQDPHFMGGWETARWAFDAGLREQIIQTLQAELERDPSDLTQHQKLVILLQMHKRPDDARIHLRRWRDQLQAEGKPHTAGRLNRMLEELRSGS